MIKFEDIDWDNVHSVNLGSYTVTVFMGNNEPFTADVPIMLMNSILSYGKMCRYNLATKVITDLGLAKDSIEKMPDLLTRADGG